MTFLTIKVGEFGDTLLLHTNHNWLLHSLLSLDIMLLSCTPYYDRCVELSLPCNPVTFFEGFEISKPCNDLGGLPQSKKSTKYQPEDVADDDRYPIETPNEIMIRGEIVRNCRLGRYAQGGDRSSVSFYASLRTDISRSPFITWDDLKKFIRKSTYRKYYDIIGTLSEIVKHPYNADALKLIDIGLHGVGSRSGVRLFPFHQSTNPEYTEECHRDLQNEYKTFFALKYTYLYRKLDKVKNLKILTVIKNAQNKFRKLKAKISTRINKRRKHIFSTRKSFPTYVNVLRYVYAQKIPKKIDKKNTNPVGISDAILKIYRPIVNSDVKFMKETGLGCEEFIRRLCLLIQKINSIDQKLISKSTPPLVSKTGPSNVQPTISIVDSINAAQQNFLQKPKRPPNDYNLFYKEQSTSTKEKYPELTNQTLHKKMGQLWKNLPEEKKSYYVEKHKIELAKYKKAFAVYIERHNIEMTKNKKAFAKWKTSEYEKPCAKRKKPNRGVFKVA